VGLASSLPFKRPMTMAVPVERRICMGRLVWLGYVSGKFAPI
jgi:hypothetical protein